jgi:hypothetical protein
VPVCCFEVVRGGDEPNTQTPQFPAGTSTAG